MYVVISMIYYCTPAYSTAHYMGHVVFGLLKKGTEAAITD